MTRPTPDRLAEIRRRHDDSCCPSKTVGDLLAELDAVTAERDARLCTCTCIDEGAGWGSYNGPEPATYEQNPWCPAHPDLDQAKQAFDHVTAERDQAVAKNAAYVAEGKAYIDQQVEAACDELAGRLVQAEDERDAARAELALWANGPTRVRDREGRLWNRTPVDVTTIWRSMDPGMSHRQCSSVDSLARQYGPLTALPEDGHDG